MAKRKSKKFPVEYKRYCPNCQADIKLALKNHEKIPEDTPCMQKVVVMKPYGKNERFYKCMAECKQTIKM